MSEKVAATYHPHLHHCPSCDRPYGSRAAALECAIEDAAEDMKARRVNRASD